MAGIILGFTFPNMYSAMWDVIASVVLTSLDLDETVLQVGVCEELVNQRQLRCNVEGFGD